MASKAPQGPSLSKDLLSGMVVFIIAIPLSLGIALASGAPPVAAIVSAILGGIVVGALSGAPIVVAGPAAGLSALVFAQIQQFGLSALFQITALAGLLQILFGALRFGRFITRLPKTILEGVLSAIGLTILLGQLHILMGQKIPGAAVANIMGLSHSLQSALSPTAGIIVPAFAVGLLAMAVQIIWPKVFTKLKWFPAALPATALATVAALSWDMPRVKLAALMPHIANHIGQMTDWLNVASWLPLIVPALGLAFVASAESLVTARGLDVLVSLRHKHLQTDLEKELVAQGAGNFCAGLLGGLPLTGVMIRSAANFESGATSRRSTMIHGLLVAVVVLMLPKLMEVIPLAVLASVLVMTGWKLLNLKSLVPAMRYHPREAYLWPLTTIAVVSTDLLKGFAFGIAVWLVVAGIEKLRRPAGQTAEEGVKVEA